MVDVGFTLGLWGEVISPDQIMEGLECWAKAPGPWPGDSGGPGRGLDGAGRVR